jgi:hypothetical protein
MASVVSSGTKSAALQDTKSCPSGYMAGCNGTLAESADSFVQGNKPGGTVLMVVDGNSKEQAEQLVSAAG